MKIKFSKYGDGVTGDCFERAIMIGSDEFYLLIFQDDDAKGKSYYAIDVSCSIYSVQIRDRKIKTKKQAFARMKRELLSVARKITDKVKTLELV